jgi:amidase
MATGKVEETLLDRERSWVERLRREEVSSEALVEACLERIARYDAAPQGLCSVIELNPDALHQAWALDRERERQGPRGPLHGLPVLVKDNIDTGDKMHTSAGALALADAYAARDAHLVERLRRAGAVLLGKANLTEWANFISDHMPNGFSARGGQTKNPYGPGRWDTGGSSSGSGVAVAAHLTALAVGTETSGSILSPSSQNGVVGVKPTVGVVSRTGIVPISHSQDTAGPMALWVEDAAYLLWAMAGADPEDPATTAAPSFPDPGPFLDPEALRGARLGVARHPYWDRVEDAKRTVLEEALERLRQAGAEVVDPVPVGPEDLHLGLEILLYEFRPNLNRYLGRLAAHLPVHTLDELIRYNLEDPQRRIPYGQQRFLDAQTLGGSLKEPAYLKARRRYRRWCKEEGIDAALQSHRLDALLFPGNLGAAVAACAGYPSVAVPAGRTAEGEPVALTFTGSAFSEPRLMGLAYAFQKTAPLLPLPPLGEAGA